MLTVETFAEVVAFLRLFDLNALVVTNALCSSLAAKASTVLRREEFPGLLFEIWNKAINVFRCFDTRNDKYGSFRLQFVTDITFPTANDMIEFIDAAFPRCIFEHVTVYWSADKHILDTIARVADCVVVNGILHLTDYTTADEPLNLALKFRKVKALKLGRTISDGEVNGIANFCCGTGIEEILLYSSSKGWTRTKLSLF